MYIVFVARAAFESPARFAFTSHWVPPPPALTNLIAVRPRCTRKHENLEVLVLSYNIILYQNVLQYYNTFFMVYVEYDSRDGGSVNSLHAQKRPLWRRVYRGYQPTQTTSMVLVLLNYFTATAVDQYDIAILNHPI